MNFYKRFIGDYRSKTARLTPLEHGVYNILLDEHYATEGPLPREKTELFQIVGARTPADEAAVDKILTRYWIEAKSGWTNARAMEEMAAFREKSTKASGAAHKRWASERNANAPANAHADALPTHAERTCNARSRDSQSQTPELEPQPKPQPQPDLRGDARERAGPPEKADCQEAMNIWNSVAERNGLAQAQRLTDKRKKQLKARLADCGGMAGWKAACEKVGASAFLLGENPRSWRADLDFVLQPTSFTKLMEGSYDTQSQMSANFRNAEAAQRLLDNRKRHDDD